MSMTETREVMDIREASEYLGVSRETLYKYVYEEKIPAFKLGNRWKFKKTVLDRWMEKQSAQFEQRADSQAARHRSVGSIANVWVRKNQEPGGIGYRVERRQGGRTAQEGQLPMSW